MSAEDDQVRRELLGMLHEAARQVAFASVVDMRSDLDSGRSQPRGHVLQIVRCLGRLHEVPVAMNGRRRPPLEDMEERDA